MTSALIEDTATAPDGRRIGYAIHGDPDGRPVVFCHGGPGSRLSLPGPPHLLARSAIRLVGIDRPGVGLSDLQPGRTLLDWPDDVDVVLQRLGIDRYAVAGVSAGGPYALACGARRPDAVDAVTVVVGLLPPSWYPDDEVVALAARDVEAARRLLREHIASRAADVDAAVAAMGARPDPDGAVYRRPEVRDLFLATYREVFRAGDDSIEGVVHDALLNNLPWGFDLADVTVPVRWWQGALDPLTPAATVRRAIDGLANHGLTVFEDEGHAAAVTHAEEIIASLDRDRA